MNTQTQTFDGKHILSIALVLFSVVIMVYLDNLHRTMWGDEPYTMSLIKFSVSSICNITASDVHPPLYYLMLKAFTIVFGNSVFAARVFSNIGFFLILLCGLFPIRKLFGNNVSFVFILILTILPVSQFMAINIRMYSWVAFFILAASLCAYQAFVSNKIVHYILLAVFSTLACYTHNYGLVASGFIYLILLFMLLKHKKNIGKFILSSIILVSLFSLWIPVILSQVETVNSKYWIEELSIIDFHRYANFFFSPKGLSVANDISSIFIIKLLLVAMLWLLLFVLAIFAIKVHRKQKNNTTNAAAICFIAVFLLMILSTIIYSITIKPIFVERYMLCACTPLLLGISIYITNIYESLKSSRFFIFASLTLLLVLSVVRFRSEKEVFIQQNENLDTIAQFISNNVSSEKQVDIFTYAFMTCIDLTILLPQYDYQLFLEDKTLDSMSKRPYSFNNVYDVPTSNNIIFIEDLQDDRDTVVNTDLTKKLNESHKLINTKQTDRYRISYYKHPF